MKRLRLSTWRRAGLRLPVLIAAIAAGASLPSAPTFAQSNNFSINWQSITAGSAVHMRNSCFVLSGTIAYLSPGILYGSGNPYTLFTGFWVAAPIADQDQLFFNGFEGCK